MSLIHMSADKLGFVDIERGIYQFDSNRGKLTPIRRNVQDPFKIIMGSSYSKLSTDGGFGVDSGGAISYTDKIRLIKLLLAIEKTIHKFGGEMYMSNEHYGDNRKSVIDYFRFTFSSEILG